MSTPQAQTHAMAWAESVAGVINRGRDPKKHVSPAQAVEKIQKTVDGITIPGLYPATTQGHRLGYPGVAPFTRGRLAARDSHTAWQTYGLVDLPDAEAAKIATKNELTGGCTGIHLRAGHHGTPIAAVGDIAVAADGKPIALEAHSNQTLAANRLADTILQSSRNLGLDPYAARFLGYTAPTTDEIAHHITQSGPSTTVLCLDAAPYHNAAATAPEQVGYVVASGIDTLRKLNAAGIPPEDAWRHISFRFAIDADQFLNIAMLRAARQVWARVGAELNIPADERCMIQHAITSKRMMSAVDPWVNLLRTTVAAFAAGVGGADSVTVLPFDSESGISDETARRLARNTQLLLLQESNIGAVADPAGGSGYVEDITRQIANKSWNVVQRIEAAGGMGCHVASKTMAEHMQLRAGQRLLAVCSREKPVTGVSEFPPLDGNFVEREPRPQNSLPSPVAAPMRDAAIFEAFRQQAAGLQEDGPLTVPVIAVGQLREHGPRLTFTKNLLAIAGIDTHVIPHTEEQPLNENLVKGSPMVIVAGSPTSYPEHGRMILTSLERAGVGRILAAGKEREWGSLATELHGTVHMGSDLLEFFSTLLREHQNRADVHHAVDANTVETHSAETHINNNTHAASDSEGRNA